MREGPFCSVRSKEDSASQKDSEGLNTFTVKTSCSIIGLVPTWHPLERWLVKNCYSSQTCSQTLLTFRTVIRKCIFITQKTFFETDSELLEIYWYNSSHLKLKNSLRLFLHFCVCIFNSSCFCMLKKSDTSVGYYLILLSITLGWTKTGQLHTLF